MAGAMHQLGPHPKMPKHERRGVIPGPALGPSPNDKDDGLNRFAETANDPATTGFSPLQRNSPAWRGSRAHIGLVCGHRGDLDNIAGATMLIVGGAGHQSGSEHAE